MGKDKKPPEYADDSFDRPPPYNPYYDQASGASGVAPPPPPTGFIPPPAHLNQPPPAYHPSPDSYKAQDPPIPQQPDRLLAQQSVPTYVRPATARESTVTNIQIHISDEFGPYAQHAVCPKCREYVVTKTKPITGALTWLSCIGLFVLGCDLGCCLVPCCVDSCRDVQHKCPNCGSRIGKYKRLC